MSSKTHDCIERSASTTAQQPYSAASRDLREYGAICVEERQIRRVVQRLAPAS